MLKNVYGEVIIPKDSILYHTTDIEYNSNKKTPFLFCSFHPSEWWNLNEIVLRVQLKRDVRLLFMIKDFRKAHINSSLNELSNNGDYLSKLKNMRKYCFREYLLKEDFDGWFSSIENRTAIEVALLNKKNTYEIISKVSLLNNFSNLLNRNNRNNLLANKKWGDLYKISSIDYPLIFNINERYKEKIKEYINYCLNFGFINDFVFQVILENVIINYHKYNYEKISWECE